MPPLRLAILLTAFASQGTLAYEDDVHYGLTRWLAQGAGFKKEQAHLIAKSNVDYDHSGLAAITLVRHSACFGRDPVVSREVRKIHFPSEAKVPGEPVDRVVQPGSDPAKSAYLRVLSVPAKSEEENLVALGQALHPLQDSWSHQGIPGSPLRLACDRTLSWGHPDARGGWKSHQADIAHRYVNDAMAMAEATYDALCMARKLLHSSPCSNPFNKFAAEVLKLTQRETKTDKAAWFKERGFSELAFLDATSIPDGNVKATHQPVDYSTASLNPIRRSSVGALPNTPEAVFMRTFFERWMTDKDMASVVKEFLALDAYRPEVGSGETLPIGFVSAEAHLKFWRVRDHGLLQLNLEGNHELITSTLQVIPTIIQEREQPYGSLAEALLPLDASGIPIATWTTTRSDGSPLLVGAARLRHAPQELLIVVAERVNGRVQVVSINSTVVK